MPRFIYNFFHKSLICCKKTIIYILANSENPYFKTVNGITQCFCGKKFALSNLSKVFMSFHFRQSHKDLLPSSEDTAKHFGGNPFKCLLCDVEFDKKKIDFQKFHLLTDHEDLIKNSVPKETTSKSNLQFVWYIFIFNSCLEIFDHQKCNKYKSFISQSNFY